MSDASHRFCKKCSEPEYACGCEEPELEESLLSRLIRQKRSPFDPPKRGDDDGMDPTT